MKTTVKVYLRDEQGNEDYFITPINLSEQEAHKYYLGNIFNMGVRNRSHDEMLQS